MVFENKINFSNATGLLEENPMNLGHQAPIYLFIDWENETVDAYTYCDNSTPGDVYHGKRSMIRLPGEVNAALMREDVDKLLPMIEKIFAGYESKWNGSNWKGTFNEESMDLIGKLIYDIEEGDYFSTIDYWGGLYDVHDYFVDRPEGLTAASTDEEIEKIAEESIQNALGDDIKIIGGNGRVIEHLKQLREELSE